jgi:putative transcriptional regulator
MIVMPRDTIVKARTIATFGSLMPTGRMIRLRLAELLKQRNWTSYRLAQETGLTVPTAYRLADPKGQFGRINFDTLDRLCAALNVQPGDLLEWVPDSSPRKPSTKRRRSG